MLLTAKNLADRTKHVVNSGKYTLFKWLKSSHNTHYLFLRYFNVAFALILHRFRDVFCFTVTLLLRVFFMHVALIIPLNITKTLW